MMSNNRDLLAYLSERVRELPITRVMEDDVTSAGKDGSEMG